MLQVSAEAPLASARGGKGGRHHPTEDDPDEVRVGPALHFHDVGAVLGEHPPALHADPAVPEIDDP